MKVNLSFLFVGMCLLYSSCIFIPKRLGKVKSISKGIIVRGDSVYFLQPFYTYATFGNSFTCAACTEKTHKQITFEKTWDSIQFKVVQKWFKPQHVTYGRRGEKQDVRPFRFKLLLGGPEEINADTASYMMANFSWNIRAGKMIEAMKFLPDSVLQLSNQKPVIIFTNDFYFCEIEFTYGGGVGSMGTGITGLNFIPDCLMLILYKGEVEYFRGYRKRYKMDKVLQNLSIIEQITLKMFDKMK